VAILRYGLSCVRSVLEKEETMKKPRGTSRKGKTEGESSALTHEATGPAEMQVLNEHQDKQAWTSKGDRRLEASDP
jgi:hypothetical protein